MGELFKLRGSLSTSQRSLLAIIGFAMVLLLWYLLTLGENPAFPAGILPSPSAVFGRLPDILTLQDFGAFSDLYKDNELIRNTTKSISINLAGYLEAILIAIPIGFLIGLLPIFRGLFQRQVDAIRYIPLTAVTGLFIAWFGLNTDMKVHYLAFGILVYLLPVVVQRIDEVRDVYLKTVYTLGATDWQTIRTVYLPSVISRLSDDIRVLTAISWTYIIIAESLYSGGGIGGLIWRAGVRQGRIDKVFALLVIIIVVGILQDKIFTYLDRTFFPFKFQNKDKYKKEKKGNSSWSAIWNYALQTLTWLGLGIYAFLFLNEFFAFMGVLKPLTYFFGEAAYAMHFLFLAILFYKGKKLYETMLKKPQTPKTA